MDNSDLSALAGNTLVAAAGTDAWATARQGFALLFGGGQPNPLAESRLDATARDLQAAPAVDLERVQAELAAQWATRIADVLEERPQVEAELRSLVNQIRAQLPARPTSPPTTKGGRHWRWPYARHPKHPPPYDQELIDWLKEHANDEQKFTIEELSRQINHAENNRKNWQRWYYGGRTTVTVAAAAVTALAAASAGLSGDAGLSVKIAAAVLSFVVAVTNGVLEVWQVTNRWRLYRVLRNRLWAVGWQLAAQKVDGDFKIFTQNVGQALDEFEHQYLMQVLLQTDGRPETTQGARQGKEQPESPHEQIADGPNKGNERSEPKP
jgi:Protein of unknown function (DUF4231)